MDHNITFLAVSYGKKKHKDFVAGVKYGIERYQEKFGCVPTLVLIPESAEPFAIDGVRMTTSRHVHPGEAYIGKENPMPNT